MSNRTGITYKKMIVQNQGFAIGDDKRTNSNESSTLFQSILRLIPTFMRSIIVLAALSVFWGSEFASLFGGSHSLKHYFFGNRTHFNHSHCNYTHHSNDTLSFDGNLETETVDVRETEWNREELRHSSMGPATNSCICTAVYQPVCGTTYFSRFGTVYFGCANFGNNCTRNCYGYSFLNNGTCPSNCARFPCGRFDFSSLGNLFSSSLFCPFNNYCSRNLFNPVKYRSGICASCTRISSSGCQRVKNLYSNSTARSRIHCIIRTQRRNSGGICNLFGTNSARCLIPGIQKYCQETA